MKLRVQYDDRFRAWVVIYQGELCSILGTWRRAYDHAYAIAAGEREP